MPKQVSPTSVSSISSNLEVDSEHTFHNVTYPSVAVMISNLKKKEEHKEKRFKISSSNETVTVKRIK